LLPKGAVIISTPHTLALKDAIKGINMFRKTSVPILGLVQNMSLYHCPACAHPSHIFGTPDRINKFLRDESVPLLGDIPLDPRIGEDAESGKPSVVLEPESERAKVFVDIARKVADRIGLSESST
jgi:ATP-binding protein involved in chromosome partitioning